MNLPGLIFSLVGLIACGATHKVTGTGNLPTIFILGAQKGGSSSLFEFLLEHPLLCQGTHKEPHFFDDPTTYGWAKHEYDVGTIPEREKYLALFPGDPKCDKKHVDYKYIDATTMFYQSALASKAIFDFYSPSERNLLKFIVVLREPVSRDYSWYEQVARDHLGGNPNMRGGGGGVPQPFNSLETFKEADAHKSRHIRRSGRYFEQLGNVTRYFRRDQLFVLSSSMMFRNTSMVMSNLAKFLGLEEIPKWKEQLPHDDHLGRKSWTGIVDCIVSHIPKLDCSYRDQLGDYYRPFNQALYAWLNATQSLASPYEPPFVQFGDDYKKLPCVQNARKAFNDLVKNDTKTSCKATVQRRALASGGPQT